MSRFGIEAYAAAIGAFPSSLFLGTLLNAVLAMIAALLLSGGFLGIAWMMAKEKHQRGKTLQHSFNFVAGTYFQSVLSGANSTTITSKPKFEITLFTRSSR